MRKLFSFLLLCTACLCFCTSCSDDDDDVKVTKDFVVGTWDVIWAEQKGESLDVPIGNIYMDLKDNGKYKVVMFKDSYIGTYIVDGNTIIGTTLDPITEKFEFTKINGKKAEINYSNSERETYKFKAVKR